MSCPDHPHGCPARGPQVPAPHPNLICQRAFWGHGNGMAYTWGVMRCFPVRPGWPSAVCVSLTGPSGPRSPEHVSCCSPASSLCTPSVHRGHPAGGMGAPGVSLCPVPPPLPSSSHRADPHPPGASTRRRHVTCGDSDKDSPQGSDPAPSAPCPTLWSLWPALCVQCSQGCHETSPTPSSHPPQPMTMSSEQVTGPLSRELPAGTSPHRQDKPASEHRCHVH